MSTATTSESAAQSMARRGPRFSLWWFRVVAALTTVSVVGQPIFAGMYLDGEFDAIGSHASNAHIVLGLVFVQAIAALCYLVPGRGRAWPLAANVVLWFLVGLQIGMGYTRNLAVHIPLGVAIVLIQIAMTVWIFLPTARQPRAWGRKK